MFAEGDDARVIEAARRLKEEGLAEPVLISQEHRRSKPSIREFAAAADYAAFITSAGLERHDGGRSRSPRACSRSTLRR